MKVFLETGVNSIMLMYNLLNSKNPNSNFNNIKFYLLIFKIVVLLTLWPIVSYLPNLNPALIILIQFLSVLFTITTMVLLYTIDLDSILDSGFFILIAYSVSTILTFYILWLGYWMAFGLVEIFGYIILSISEQSVSSGKRELNFIINPKFPYIYFRWLNRDILILWHKNKKYLYCSD